MLQYPFIVDFFSTPFQLPEETPARPKHAHTFIGTFTLEIIGNVEDTGNIIINSNITLVAAEGSHTITSASGGIVVQGGGALTLGDNTSITVLVITR